MPKPRGAVLVLVLALAAYSGTLRHGLLWDDPALVRLVESRERRGGVPALLGAEFRLEEDKPLGYYRPLVLASLWLDGRAFSWSPAAMHAHNALLHGAASVLVHALLLAAAGSAPAALAGGALFALHPAHVESVAFVSGRTDLLCALFLLLSARLWMRGRTGRGTRPGPADWLALGAWALACLAKETAFVLPAVLLAWDLLDAGPDGGPVGTRLRRAIPWALRWGAVLAALLLLRQALGIGLGAGAPGTGPEPARMVARAAEYARLLVVPWPLNAWYTPSQVRLGALGAACALGLVAAAAVGGGRETGRAGLKGLLWCGAFLLPVLGPVGLAGAEIAERFLYIPSIGWALVVAGLCARAAAAGRRLFVPACASVAAAALLFGSATVLRARTWRDEETFYRTLARTSPDSALGEHGLGRALAARGDLEGAIGRYREALRKEPSAAYAHASLGEALLRSGRAAEAYESFSRALALAPESADALVNLGAAAAALGRLEEAERRYAQALARWPRHARALFNLGNLRQRQNRSEEALAAWREALAADPDLADAHFNLARALAGLGRGAESERHYREVLRLDPGATDALNNLAWLLLSGGEGARERSGEAIALAGRACEITRRRDPSCLDTLAAAYAAAGRMAEAARTAGEALAAAEAAGDRALRDEIAGRREGYLAGARPGGRRE